MSDQDRSLQPTAKRRQMARAEGYVAVSVQVTAATIWLAASCGLLVLGGAGLTMMKDMLVQLWQSPWTSIGPDVATGAERLREAVLLTGTIVLPVASLCFAAAVVSRFAQVGYVWAPQRLLPNTQRLNPARRASELFSTGALSQLLRGAGLSCVTFLLLGWGLWSQRDSLARFLVVPMTDFQPLLLSVVSMWMIRLGICLLIFAALDYASQRYRYEVNLRMSSEDLRAEIQAVQANPQVAAGRRDLHREVRRHR